MTASITIALYQRWASAKRLIRFGDRHQDYASVCIPSLRIASEPLTWKCYTDIWASHGGPSIDSITILNGQINRLIIYTCVTLHQDTASSTCSYIYAFHATVRQHNWELHEISTY